MLITPSSSTRNSGSSLSAVEGWLPLFHDAARLCNLAPLLGMNKWSSKINEAAKKPI
jgi:hypothetical protein